MSSENVFSLSKDSISAIDLSIQVCLFDMLFIWIKACSLSGSGMKSSADIYIGWASTIKQCCKEAMSSMLMLSC